LQKKLPFEAAFLHLYPMEITKIYGIHALKEAIDAEMAVEKVYVQEDTQHTKIQSLLKECASLGATISYVPLEKLNKLSKARNHQGIVATISPIGFIDIEALIDQALEQTSAPIFMLLDQISDVRNFGAIVRSAVAAGAQGIIVQKKGGAPVNADAIKTSAGALFKIPVCKVDHIKDAILYLQAANINLIAATEKESQSIYDTDFSKGFALIMGSEGRGINPSVLTMVDTKVNIPINDQIDSLNVSVASAVILFEAIRQRQ